MECRVTIISAILITTFVYTLLHTHFSSITRITRLQEEVEEITKVILGRNPDETLLPQIDNFVKKRTQGLWDELTSVKKKLDLIEGNSGGSCGFCKKTTSLPTDLQVVSEEEPNYALKSIGAAIVHTEDDPLNSIGFWDRILGIRYKSNDPDKLLNPSMQLGSCYAFKGDKSSFTIKLSHKIFIRAITVEHIHESVSLTGDISNAPKDFIVYGVDDLDKGWETMLGSFQYNITKTKRVQTFYLNNGQSFHYCKIKVVSNHGNPDYTCIYRLAVHGKL
ncbi:SUN domain-containing protein 5-like isoform X2 [Episyrphus balteatus]|uniref:SUN domain-containing protein 5-like isoform X2 n=1 Tax=Episyrphus balteatus TaxID=286459 RepID=UPI00248634F1|nr:SUN domain-containing protein 5-like isoform X2 [Episyrphus balteatus]